MRIPYESLVTFTTCQPFDESGCLGLQPKLGGRSHLKLNIAGRLIAKKYSDGKVKRTLKRRSKVLENVKRETDRASNFGWAIPFCRHCTWWCLFYFCMQAHQVDGVDIWYFVHLIVSIKHSTGGDTTLLGRLAKAGCFGFVGNICDAFGKKCVLSGN